jgi:LacI family transcriptional regulator
MKKKVTLHDIAKVLNLSTVSVSKALRNHPDISDATKKKVSEVAVSMGYRPNLIARSLTSSKSKTLGVVVPKIAHNFFAHILAGVQEYAVSRGYSIVLTVSDEQEELEKKHIETLVSMQVEGLLVSVSTQTRSTDIFKWVSGLQLPLVFFDRHIPDLGFNSVIINDEKASMDAVDELINRGYTNIAHLGGYDHILIGKNRRMGYEKALVKNNIAVDPNKIVLGGFDEESGYNGFKELVSRGETPEVIFGATFPVVLGAYAAMREVNPAYIDEIKALSFHGEAGLLSFVPFPQFYVVQPAVKIGYEATRLLLDEIEGIIKPENFIEYVDTHFVESEKGHMLKTV